MTTVSPAPPPPAVAPPPVAKNTPATVSLVFGIISLVLNPLLFTSLVGLITGIIGAVRGPIGRTKAIVGIVLSVIGAGVGIIITIVVLHAVGIAGQAISTAAAERVASAVPEPAASSDPSASAGSGDSSSAAPAGYKVISDDVWFKWGKTDTSNQFLTQKPATVITPNGCRSLLIEVNEYDKDGTNVGSTYGSATNLGAGDKAKVTFNWSPQDHVRTVKVSDATCI